MTKRFAHIPGLIGRELVAALRTEAAAHLAQATPVDVPESSGTDGRGGNPRRRLLSAAAGPVQQTWYQSPGLRTELERIAGVRLKPTGGGGTFSYYLRPGDHISIHRDIVTCDFTVITCLVHTPAEGNSGQLVFWPWRGSEPLAGIRANPGPGSELLRLEEGESAVVFGGLVPHAVLPVRAGQRRVVSLLCFEAVLR